MGLSADFKKYVTAQFPEACTQPENAPEAVVVDVMVVLHSFVPKEDMVEPAQKLADSLFYAVRGSKFAAFCFDVSKDTPAAKEIEWQARKKPDILITQNDIEEHLLFDLLPEYTSLIASRQARTYMCQWLVEQLVIRMNNDDMMQSVYFFGAFDTPSCYRKIEGEGLVYIDRPDLKKTLHGEADISGIFAAHAIKSECGAQTVELRTSDTDWVVIAMLNNFEGLRVRLQHYDRKTSSFISWYCSVQKLSELVTAKYAINVNEFAILCLSKGSDYVKNAIAAFPDWSLYIEATAKEMISIKKRRGEVITHSSVDVKAMHAVFVEASANKSRAKLNYSMMDGFLSRLSFNYLYFLNAPLRGGERLDCFQYGWQRNAAGKVETTKVYKDKVDMM